MELDRQTCAEARKTRDPRLGGRIFFGSARTAKGKDCVVLGSAAAAAEAGVSRDAPLAKPANQR